MQTLPKAGTRHGAVAQALRELAKQSGPNIKLPTTRELCVRLNTNPVILSYVLDELEEQGIIYRRKRNGIFVSPDIHRRTIVVLLDVGYFQIPNASPFWSLLLNLLMNKMQDRTDELGDLHRFQIVDSRRFKGEALPQDIMAELHTGLIHGVVAIGIGSGGDWEDIKDLPIVAYAGDSYWSVEGTVQSDTGCNNAPKQAVHHLAAVGCERIGLWAPVNMAHSEINVSLGREISPDTNWSNFCARIGDYAQAEGLTWSREWVVPAPANVMTPLPPSYADQGYRLATETFSRSREERPDGLIVMDDMMALGVIAALRDLNIELARDVHMISVTNQGSNVLYGYEKSIGRIEVAPTHIIEALLDVLENLIAEKPPQRRMTFVRPCFLAPAQKATQT